MTEEVYLFELNGARSVTRSSFATQKPLKQVVSA
jgi:hypothetical protein